MTSLTPSSSDSPPIEEKKSSVVPLNTTVISIIGTGQYGRSLANRLRRCYSAEVRVGSRTPVDGQHSIEAAVTDANVLFLAVPAHKHKEVIQSIAAYLALDTIVVDISNHPLHSPPQRKPHQSHDLSIAERLQKLMPDITVVKGFNTTSSYALNDMRRTPSVYFASDSIQAVEELSKLCSQAGLVSVYSGKLEAARELEAASHRLFPTWRKSIWTSIIVLAWWVLYNTLTKHVVAGFRGFPNRQWRMWPLEVFMSATGETAMTLFALTFLLGPIAGVLQIARGSASKPFGKFFGSWLDARKELGVVAFFFVSMHACAGAIKRPHLKETSSFVEHAYFSLGILSYAFFAILAVCSLPSVAETMSWSEFRAIFSWVGTIGLLFGALHQGFWGWVLHKYYETPKKWVGNGALMPSHWLGIILPIAVLFFRFIMWSPCISVRLRKLRNEVSAPTMTSNSE